ncbi:hypothetical protein [Chryseobacterium elymi]|uniref:hypothetical protein n=1 Tax=Chryseobacterium elymi TaxID=395936 RepID=UPI001EE90995|nr:hypothetical protein [Chryseobacterium elymi]
MNTQEQITEYITSQPEPKYSDIQELHRIIFEIIPECKSGFLNGKNSESKTVSNPNIGSGRHTIHYAGGKTREILSTWSQCEHNRNFCLYPQYQR